MYFYIAFPTPHEAGKLAGRNADLDVFPLHFLSHRVDVCELR